jgi:hypothetical protein
MFVQTKSGCEGWLQSQMSIADFLPPLIAIWRQKQQIIVRQTCNIATSVSLTGQV